MKRLLAILLSAVLVFACLPLTASARELSVRDKLQSYVDGMDFNRAEYYDTVYYEEIAYTDKWVLFYGGLALKEVPDTPWDYPYGVFGNKIIAQEQSERCFPFKLNVGVYDKKAGAFYDIIDAWDMGFDGLHAQLNAVNTPMFGKGIYMIGDADMDGDLTILDATRIQRILAGLDGEGECANCQTCLRGFQGNQLDCDRDGGLSILDATKIQRRLAGLPNNIDYMQEFNVLCDYSSAQNECVLARSVREYRDVLNKYEAQALSTSAGENIDFDKYDEEFFTTRSLLLAYIYLPDFSHELTLRSLVLGDDERLTLTAEDHSDMGPGAEALNPRLICLSIFNGCLTDISGTELELIHSGRSAEPASFTAEVLPEDEWMFMSDGAVYSKLDSEIIDVSSALGRYDFYWNNINLPDTSAGYVMLIHNREDFEAMLPGFDTEGAYGSDFFKDHSVVAFFGQGTDDSAYASLGDMAVRGDTLLVNASVQYKYAADSDGAPIARPTAPIVWAFAGVSKSGVAEVKSFDFWKPRAEVDYDNIPAGLIDNHIYQGENLTELNAGVLVSAAADIPAGIDKLYVGYDGGQLDRGQTDKYAYKAEKLTAKYFRTHQLIILRYYQGGSDVKVKLKNVRRSADGKLTVKLSRSTAEPFVPDNAWRFMILSVPLLDRNDYSVEVRDDSGEYEGLIYTAVNGGVEIIGYNGSQSNVTLPRFIEGSPVVSVGAEAFRDNTVIQSISMPGCVKRIGDEAFMGCTELTYANLQGSQITQIPERCFKGCEKLSFCPVPGELSIIGAEAFSGCAAMSYAQVTDNTRSIGSRAFKGCDKITSVHLPEAIVSIGGEAFGYTANGEKVKGFTVYGYEKTPARTYADQNGFKFIKLDGTGEIAFDVIDAYYSTAELKLKDGRYTSYITSPAEVAQTINEMFTTADGQSARDRDDHRFAAGELDDEWFETRDLIGICYHKNYENSMTPREVAVEPENILTVVFESSFFIPYHPVGGDSNDQEGEWAFFFLAVQKREEKPQSILIQTVDPNVAYKPVIYLYPEEETELTVTLGKPGELTCTYPAYNNGWHVTARPDGTLTDQSGRSYYALYWEGGNIHTGNTDEGFVVRGCDTAAFLEEKLAVLGLSDREAQEFIIYWLPILQKNKYNQIRFATREEIDEAMPLEFSVQPDTVIRVLMQYKPLERPIPLRAQKLASPERRGFVAVEWGGAELK